MNNLMISRKSLQAENRDKIMSGKGGAIKLVDFSRPLLSGRLSEMNQDQKFEMIKNMTVGDMIPSTMTPSFTNSGKYGGGFYVPMKWSDGSTEGVYDRIVSGKFKMVANTLPVDWANLWDAIRIDVSVRKAAIGTVRQFIYNITTNPNFTRTIKPTEITPIGIIFEENNGHGQAVPQGETTGGGYDSITVLIYAAGFTFDLIAELFDLTITPERVADAVMVGEDALKDELAIGPIRDFSYAGVQQTAASAIGSLRQELLWNTLQDAFDDLGDRLHPVTDRTLNTSNVVILAHPFDAPHIVQVARGLPSTNQMVLGAFSQISQVIAYDDEIIKQRAKTTTYSGVTKGTAYMIIPASSLPANGYMEIAVKRDLVVEVDSQPDVKTLTREERAYWFAEAIWTEGIQYFIQEISLPTW